MESFEKCNEIRTNEIHTNEIRTNDIPIRWEPSVLYWEDMDKTLKLSNF